MSLTPGNDTKKRYSGKPDPCGNAQIHLKDIVAQQKKRAKNLRFSLFSTFEFVAINNS